MTALTLTKSAIPTQTSEDNKKIEALKSFTFLPRLELKTAASNAVKDGKIPANHYVLMAGEDMQDLGKTLVVFPLVKRWKAMDFSDGGVINDFDDTSERFLDIQSRSSVENSGCQWGVEFLFYLPSVGKYCTFMCGSVTARGHASTIQALLPQETDEGQSIYAAIMDNRKITQKSKNRSWYGFDCKPSDQPVEIPDIDELNVQVNKFLTEKSTEAKEVAPEDSSSDRD